LRGVKPAQKYARVFFGQKICETPSYQLLSEEEKRVRGEARGKGISAAYQLLSEEEKRARGEARGKGISAAHQLRQASVLADATSPVEAKIVKAVAADAAVAQKPVGAVLYNIGWWARPSRQFVERFAAHLPTVGDLARANVDFDALLAIFGPVESKSGVSRARKKLWELICAAAAQFSVVEIGALPRKNAAARN